MSEYEKTADRLIDEARTRTGSILCLDDEWDELRGAIAFALTAAVRAEREKWKAFAGPDGEPRSHCLNCGTWWDRNERCPLCINTHAETKSALAAQTTTDAGVKT